MASARCWLARSSRSAAPLDGLYAVLDIVEVSRETGRSVDLASQQRALATGVLKLTPEAKTRDALLTKWEAHYSAPIARMREVVTDLKGGQALDLAMLSVALRELRGLG